MSKRGKFKYIVGFDSTATIEVWADTEAEAREEAGEKLTQGDTHNVTAQFFENAQAVAATKA